MLNTIWEWFQGLISGIIAASIIYTAVIYVVITIVHTLAVSPIYVVIAWLLGCIIGGPGLATVVLCKKRLPYNWGLLAGSGLTLLIHVGLVQISKSL